MIRLLVCAALVCMTTAVQMKCGTTFYDSQWNQCCSGIICPRKGANSQCCGSTTYDENTEICCKNTVNEKKSSHMRCCGATAYDENTQECDTGDRVMPFTGRGCPRHDPSKKICCNGHLWNRVSSTMDCCNGIGFDRSKEECCDGTVSPIHENHGGCCGHQAYNADTHLCCSGILQRKANNDQACCGPNLMDTNVHICCSGHIQMVDRQNPNEPLACCGYNVYNTKHHYCCKHPPSSEFKIYKKHTGHGQIDGCCDALGMDSAHYFCHRSYIQKKEANTLACGSTTYNIEYHICCRDDKWSEVLHPVGSCCGLNRIGKNDKYLKCDDQVVVLA